jgi:pimeloyl-ACP methyl ester carboxylesterase
VSVFGAERPGARLSALGREAFALARQAALMRYDLSTVVPSGADAVVLVHGFLATAGVLRPLRDAIERDTGAGIATFTHVPGVTIDELGGLVGEIVAKLAAAERIHLVGHSIGGLAVRFFVQELGGDPRVKGTVSIASPFSGARRAWLLPGKLGRQLEADSPFLERLRVGLARDTSVPHLSIAGSHDATVPHGALPPGAPRLLVPGCGHNAVLYHPRTLEAVTAQIRARSAGLRAEL